MSQLRYLDGLKVTFKFVLAAVMIVNVGIGLFVRKCSETALLDKVLHHEIHCMTWGKKTHFNTFPLWCTHKLSVHLCVPLIS